MSSRSASLSAAICLALLAPAAWTAEESARAAAGEPAKLPRVDVIGDAENLPRIGGAADTIDGEAIEAARPFTVNEALRQVAGINVRDEEGFGIRPNIGMRGLNPTRSTKITLLEDGIPLAYAPYGDNASYYHPQIDRYARIEALKGTHALLFGPQTVGGVINYITPDAPRAFGGYLQAAGGNRDYANGHLNIGGRGFLFDYVYKQGQGARDNLEHELNDLNLKYTVALGARQALTLRANHYTEDSQITYTGLTEAEFANFGAQYNPFKNDHFDIERTGVSATHELDFGAARLLTNVYYAGFDRDWWRQSSNSTDSQCGTTTFIVDGVSATFAEHRLAGRLVDPGTQCNSAQGRLRSYDTWGIEPRLSWSHRLGEFQAGIKAHFEEQERFQVNGATPTARTGTTVEDNLRETKAYSAFIANRFDLGKFSITPVVRYEDFDADRSDRLMAQSGSTSVARTLAGIGATWSPGERLTLFTSLHRGFAPPRVEDLIGGAGTVTEVDPEKSNNFELGVRARPFAGVDLQAVYFRSDFDNLIAVGSIAGGSTPLSQGEALFEGLELGAHAGFGHGFYGRFAWTWLEEAEQTTPFVRVDTGAAIGAAGNRQPYAPEHMVTGAAGWSFGPFQAELEAQYVDEQYSDFANTLTPAASGQTGLIDAWTVWNVALNYDLGQAFTVFLTLKNVADETYIVDRTRGIQVGQPRLVQAGVRYAF